MKLYAIRDRLLDYFLQPFTGPGDKEVMGSLATSINTEESTNAIQAAPHHFELWRLAEIEQETGHVKASHEFLCDCSSLLRGRVRDLAATEPGAGANAATPRRSTRPPGGARQDSVPNQPPPAKPLESPQNAPEHVRAPAGQP